MIKALYGPIPVGFFEPRGKTSHLVGSFEDGDLETSAAQIIGCGHSANSGSNDSDMRGVGHD
jgi:hypothetical protein